MTWKKSGTKSRARSSSQPSKKYKPVQPVLRPVKKKLIPAPDDNGPALQRILSNEETRFAADLGDNLRKLYMWTQGIPIPDPAFSAGRVIEVTQAFLGRAAEIYENAARAAIRDQVQDYVPVAQKEGAL